MGDLYTRKIENLESVQVPNNYSAGCSLHGDVATQGILVGPHNSSASFLSSRWFLTQVKGRFIVLYHTGMNNDRS